MPSSEELHEDDADARIHEIRGVYPNAPESDGGCLRVGFLEICFRQGVGDGFLVQECIIRNDQHVGRLA
jgi:hypothetical protein